jgi:hypothetical protein
LGVWDPVEARGADSRAGRLGDRGDSDAGSRAIRPAVNSKPSPPIPLRLAFLVALASLALRILSGGGLRLARRLEDYAWSRRQRRRRTSIRQANALPAPQREGNLAVRRAPPPPTLSTPPKASISAPPSSTASAVVRTERPRGPAVTGHVPRPRDPLVTAKPTRTQLTRRVRPVRGRRRRAATTRVRTRSARPFLRGIRDGAVTLTLAAGLGVVIGVLAHLYG